MRRWWAEEEEENLAVAAEKTDVLPLNFMYAGVQYDDCRCGGCQLEVVLSEKASLLGFGGKPNCRKP